jgi:hypothetical protein
MAELKKIEIKVAGLTVKASLEVTGPGKQLFEALPISGSVNTWGDEIYFTISESLEVSETTEVVEIGDIAFWKPGNALCVFFGLTPMSTPGEIRPASRVSVVGKIDDDPRVLKKAKDGDTIEIYRAE